MKGKYLRRFGVFVLAVLLLPSAGILLASMTVEAQRRGRVIIVRPIVRPFRPWGWGYRGYDPYFDYYSRYSHYVFDDSDKAYNQGFKDGTKTGRGDAKNDRTYNPQRSHYYQEAGFGNFGEVYRSGFLRGYEEGFRS